MESSQRATEAWSSWWELLQGFNQHLRRSGGQTVSSTALRAEATQAVQYYFRRVRPHLQALAIPESQTDQLDWITQYILKLASRSNRKNTYFTRLRELTDLRAEIESEIEIRSAAGMQAPAVLTTATESAIISTLDRILPTSALSYKQVLHDLAERQRTSYRGTAAELREVVRELLDHLAPDEEVLKTIKLDRDQRRPSMKQKAIFILKARGVGETARKPAEHAVAAIEESVGALARSIYDRGSLATHVATTRQEVLIFKGYADAVLADLLQIHK